MSNGMRNSRSISDEVHTHLRNQILSNHLKPGQKLVDRDLAKALGVSRTPVREALIRLHHEGLVESRQGKGYSVVDIDAQQAADLYDLREVLEGRAIRLAMERAKPEDLNELAEVLATLETYRNVPEKRGEEIKLGLSIHKIIARASGDAVLHEILVRLLDRMLLFIWLESISEDPELAEATRREHAAFLTVIREKRTEDAEALVRTHIQKAKEHMLRMIKAREAFYEEINAMPQR